MPAEREKWLAKALQDEIAVDILKAASGPKSLIAYHLQQATEKRLKAEMVGRGLRTRKSHDLEALVAEMGISAPDKY